MKSNATTTSKVLYYSFLHQFFIKKKAAEAALGTTQWVEEIKGSVSHQETISETYIVTISPLTISLRTSTDQDKENLNNITPWTTLKASMIIRVIRKKWAIIEKMMIMMVVSETDIIGMDIRTTSKASETTAKTAEMDENTKTE